MKWDERHIKDTFKVAARATVGLGMMVLTTACSSKNSKYDPIYYAAASPEGCKTVLSLSGNLSTKCQLH